MQIRDFLQRRADEVMLTNVTTLSPDDSLANTAYKFLHRQISGAPVVDQDGKCVGVLFVTDVVGAAEKVASRQAEIADAFFGRSALALPANVCEEDLAKVRDKIAPVADPLFVGHLRCRLSRTGSGKRRSCRELSSTSKRAGGSIVPFKRDKEKT